MKFLPLSLILLLAACGSEQRFAVPPVTPEARVGIAYRSVEIRDVALPSYAQFEEIFVESENGVLESESGLLWADEPGRAVTLELARALSTISSARVAPEPWPFDNFPDARVDVRVEEFVASRRGEFRLAGQYFVAPLDGSNRDRANTFRISVPLAPDAGPGGIAIARGQAMALLAEQIARNGLR